MKNRSVLCGLGLLILLSDTVPALCQIGGYPGRPGGPTGTNLPPVVPGGGRGSRTRGDRNDKTADTPLPTFTGKIKGVDKKTLTIEDQSNTLLFRCSKKTHYYEGEKKISASALKPGDAVSVEGKRSPDGSIDAVSVRLERQKPEPAK